MGNPILQALPWRCKKLTKLDFFISSLTLSLIVFSFSFLFKSTPETSPTFPINSDYVELTLLRNAKQRGAFCLDGSLPGYHFEKGFGSGSNNWMLHIEGGGWCGSVRSCSSRKASPVGSSNHMERQVLFSGILSHYPTQNPDFFNWNKVKIRYCDGASFAGHPESELNGTNLFFRGQLIWEALMDELLEMGMANAKQALLTGCSAGGLATMIHCDDYRRRLPKADIVKCLGDASVFLDEKDLSGGRAMQLLYQNVVKLHGVAKSLPSDCVANNMDAYKCFFPQQLLKSIKTPIFLVQPGYDYWQIQNILVPSAVSVQHSWQSCRLGLHSCSSSQMEILHGYRNSLLSVLTDFEKNIEGGMFINSCFIHCQIWQDTWHGPNSPKVDNKTIAESVGEWYFGRERVKRIDCPFPCNPSCTNKDFLQH